MFTGLVEEVGTVTSLNGDRMRIAADLVLDDVELGASIAVDGCCLTVVAHGDDWWETDLSPETLDRTHFGDGDGRSVNLERAALVGSRLGGHLVQGHVDAVGTVLAPCPDLEIEIPERLRHYVVEKGSVTVDGVSLTVASLTERGVVIAIIPHTAEVTTLGERHPGDRVHIEVDVIAKYVERQLDAYPRTPEGADR